MSAMVLSDAETLEWAATDRHDPEGLRARVIARARARIEAEGDLRNVCRTIHVYASHLANDVIVISVRSPRYWAGEEDWSVWGGVPVLSEWIDGGQARARAGVQS